VGTCGDLWGLWVPVDTVGTWGDLLVLWVPVGTCGYCGYLWVPVGTVGNVDTVVTMGTCAHCMLQ
jgi:hypothetical protein